MTDSVKVDSFDQLNDLCKAHVPLIGQAKTVGGEVCRATVRLLYRWFNDGDYFWEGYGIETCAPAVLYLKDLCYILPLNAQTNHDCACRLVAVLNELEYVHYDENQLKKLALAVLDFLNNSNLFDIENTTDFWTYSDRAIERYGDPYESYDNDYDYDSEYDEQSFLKEKQNDNLHWHTDLYQCHD